MGENHDSYSVTVGGSGGLGKGAEGIKELNDYTHAIDRLLAQT